MDLPTTESRSPSLLREGVEAVKANRTAIALLWPIGAAIVASYYLVPSVTQSLDDLAAFKGRVGIWYAIIATSLFCGLIPFIMQVFQQGDRKNWSARYLIFLLVFWDHLFCDCRTLPRLL